MTQQQANWTVLDVPGVDQVARRAAARVAREYSDQVLFDADDLYQEALIMMATTRDAAECLGPHGMGLGVLHTRTVQGLQDKVRTEIRRANRKVPLSTTCVSETSDE